MLNDAENSSTSPSSGDSMNRETGLGKLIIISGPSGVGKTTVLKNLFADCPLPLVESVSATTRPKRPGETDGQSYHYLTQEEFDRRRENNEFLESCEVFGRGHWYGTLRETVNTSLKQGNWIVLEIDVEGAGKVLKLHPDAITIFIHPGSLEELERRLRGRETETEQSLTRRLEVAKSELDASPAYSHIVTNETVEQTANDICKLLQKLEKN
jgi:guanylate kinase